MSDKRGILVARKVIPATSTCEEIERAKQELKQTLIAHIQTLPVNVHGRDGCVVFDLAVLPQVLGSKDEATKEFDEC